MASSLGRDATHHCSLASYRSSTSPKPMVRIELLLSEAARLARYLALIPLPSSSGQDLRLSSGRYRFDSDREYRALETSFLLVALLV